jgi:glycosyltransferase involved in cell wall biosynthesis
LVGLKTPTLRARAESDVRKLSLEFRKTPVFNAIELQDFVYLNTGHSNLSKKALAGITTHVKFTAIFLHDLIPVEFPEFQRPQTVTAFKEKIENITDYADLIIVNSEDTKMRTKSILSRNVDTVSAHLGIDVPTEASTVNDHTRPYFTTIGTIEPRKNHKLLLDIWLNMIASTPDDQIPHLHIVGRRGWLNEGVFTQLNRPEIQRFVTEHNNLPDAEMWSLLKGANALLFPSLAEGFGLPSLEAAALGVPVICGDLAIHHELLGDYPVYVDLLDPYLWQDKILEQTQATNQTSRPTPHIPTWDEHFARVNQAITEKR